MPLLDTTIGRDFLGNFVADLVLQILSFAAEQERSYIRQRQSEGIAAAKANGVKFGRPKKELPENFEELYRRYLLHEPIARIAKSCPSMSESTLRLRLQEREKLDNSNKQE